jgi:hypothetical protein
MIYAYDIILPSFELATVVEPDEATPSPRNEDIAENSRCPEELLNDAALEAP